jgi:hypothetical protein
MSAYGMSRLVARSASTTVHCASPTYRIPDAFFRFSMANQSEDHTEDLESQSPQVSVASKDEKDSIVAAAVASSDPDRDESTTKPKVAPSTASTTNGKRQRTLFDMLGSTPKQGPNTPSKKPKFTASGSSAGNEKPSAVSSSGGGSSTGGLQTLNSIPFSSSEYFDSLTGDQKRLLTLECETMGKSW